MRSPGAAEGADGRSEGGRKRVDEGWSTALRAGVLGGALLGALLLIASEFMPLYRVATTTGDMPIKSVSTGSHDAYALIPIALVAAALAYGGAIRGSRVALLALGALGLATLLIALIGDLPDAQATGVIGNTGTHFQQAAAKPQAGLYIETLGAILLIVSSGCALLLGAPMGTRGRPQTAAADDGAGPPQN